MTRIVLGIEYDGSGFFGWQWQSHRRSVQGELEAALSRVANQPITVICAGRTDSGVHAFEQVVHFDVNVERNIDAWLLGGNSYLPDEIRITWVKHAIEGFHARYSAIARLYRYVILNRPVNSALQSKQVTWCYQPLDAEKMNRAAQHLVGNHDFSSFRAQGCQSKSPFRMIHFVDVHRDNDKVIIDICANAFLHHMVRNIAGVLMAIGTGKQPEQWVLELLNLRARKLGGVTAAPYGLYLAGIYYPAHYGIVKHPSFNKLPENTKRFD
ncbi:MAG: tRNA pseudouridine(38-40) synthase TruA [Methyloglobulus sp.]|nr:tRNA pseudouridine(38-40) synthase TruA [Methyloglobulus sp.]